MVRVTTKHCFGTRISGRSNERLKISAVCSCSVMFWSLTCVKIHSQNDVGFIFSRMEHRVISLGGRGVRNWSDGLGVGDQSSGHQDRRTSRPLDFYFWWDHVKSFVCHIRQRNIDGRQIWLLLVETSYARLYRTCSMLCVN